MQRCAAVSAQATRAIRAVLDQLEPRDRHIFAVRTLRLRRDARGRPSRTADGPSTLEAIGQVYGITRERVRQLQRRTERRVRRQLEDDPAARALAAALPARLGVAFPLAGLAEVPELADLDAPGLGLTAEERAELWRTAVWSAGFSLAVKRADAPGDGWALREGVTPDALLGILRERAASTGRLALRDARATLATASVSSSVAAALLDETPEGMKRFGETFLPWPPSLTDKAEVILRWLGRPASDEEIFRLIDEPRSHRGFRNRLTEDRRFVRTDRSVFALRSWGMQEYLGISDEIAAIIERAGGETSMADIVADITDRFSVAESSVRAYANAPRFVSKKGRVRVRTDEPVDLSLPDALTVAGAYRPSPDRLRFLLDVIRDTLRGSGRMVPAPVAAALGVGPGGERLFLSETGARVRISWRMASPSGPNIGSVKSFADQTGAALGDRLALDFDTARGTVEATRVPAEAVGAERLRLTLGEDAGDRPLEALAAALRVEPARVRETLRARRDDDMLAALAAAAPA